MLSAISSWFDKEVTTTTSASASWEKSDLVNWLATQHGYKTYLEVATAMTGGQYARISRETFTRTERLLYRTPKDFDDGSQIDYRCESEDNRIALAQIRGQGKAYDIVFLDSYHTYAGTMSDLENAIELLNTRGMLVIHDCNPLTEDLVCPDFVPGTCWCGLTYAAFLDFVHRRTDLAFHVVDTDFGVGIVRRRQDFQLPLDESPEAAQLRHDVTTAARQLNWNYFDTHRRELLHLISVEEFFQLYRQRKGRVGRFLASKNRQRVA